MAAITPITLLRELTLPPDGGDWLVAVDITDTTQSPSGTTKKIRTATLFTRPTFVGPTSVAGGTVTINSPVLDLSQTWNNAGIPFRGIHLNITNTASASNSLLIDLQVGGVSQFTVDTAGGTTAQGSITTQGLFKITGGSGAAEQGTISIQLATGLNIVGVNANTHSWTILNESLNPVMRGPIGTQDVRFYGIAQIPGVSAPVDDLVLGIGATTQSNSILGGPAQTLPSAPAGYLVWYYGSTRIAVPYYATA